MLQSMVFSASLPISAMVSPVRKNESTNDEYTHLPLSVSETRERNERCIKLERHERFPDAHTKRRTTKTRTTEEEDKEEEDAPNSTRR